MPDIPILKVVIAGDNGVGKTSLVRQFCEGRFDASNVHTIGVDFKSRVVDLTSGPVKLSIWDLDGHERFEVVRAGLYRGSLATALVFSLEEYQTLKALARWYREIRQSLPDQHYLVVGNKSDLVEQPDDAHARELARVLGAPYIRTSARTGSGVDEMFVTMAGLALGSYNST